MAEECGLMYKEKVESMRNVESSIKSLEKGDLVRITLEMPVVHASSGVVMLQQGECNLEFHSTSLAIKSVEVLPKPLAVWDPVVLVGAENYRAVIRAIAEDHALIKLEDGSITSAPLKNLKRP